MPSQGRWERIADGALPAALFCLLNFRFAMTDMPDAVDVASVTQTEVQQAAETQ